MSLMLFQFYDWDVDYRRYSANVDECTISMMESKSCIVLTCWNEPPKEACYQMLFSSWRPVNRWTYHLR